MSQSWEEATKWESDWHGNCVNSLGEEYKQFAYAKRMGMKIFHNGKSPFTIDMTGKRVADIGGGPYSMLLKAHGLGSGTVIDPCQYPAWIYYRYGAAGISVVKQKAEDYRTTKGFDWTLIYNCLQHVEDPERIVKNALHMSKEVRVFEWIENGVSDGHLHNLTEDGLNNWFGGYGKTEKINENTAVGLCYYGIFKGELA